MSQVNQAGEKGRADTFLNLRTERRAARPKLIMIDSIRMNRDWVRMAVSANNIFSQLFKLFTFLNLYFRTMVFVQ